MAELPADHPFAGPDPERRLREALARIDTDVSPRRSAVRQLAAATRAVIDELVRTSADAEAVEEAAALVERAATLLAQGPLDRPYGGAAEASLGPDAGGGWSGDRSFLEFSPLFGQANALAPPLVIRAEAGAVRATAVFGAAYEGPPGCVHGGFIAAAFDEVLGMAQSLTGNPGMTGRLTIRYRSPTPLHRPLALEGRVVRVEGRKIFTEATLHDDAGTLCAEAEGLFISIDFSKFADLLHEREG